MLLELLLLLLLISGSIAGRDLHVRITRSCNKGCVCWESWCVILILILIRIIYLVVVVVVIVIIRGYIHTILDWILLEVKPNICLLRSYHGGSIISDIVIIIVVVEDVIVFINILLI